MCALIKYSALVSGMSGKLNGSVAARNKGGNYIRNKTTPVNPQSTFQQQARAMFGGVSSLFRSLTADKVNSWNAAAANFPYTNIFGDTSFLNGLQLFTKLNTNLSVVDTATLTTPPSPEGAGSLVLDSARLAIAAEELTILFSSTPPESAVLFVLEATAPVSGNSRFYKNRFRTIAFGSAASLGDVNVIFENYRTRFGVPPVGANVAFRLSQVNENTGERSVGSVVQGLVSP